MKLYQQIAREEDALSEFMTRCDYIILEVLEKLADHIIDMVAGLR